MRLILEYSVITDEDVVGSTVTKPILYKDLISAEKDLNTILKKWLKEHYLLCLEKYILIEQLLHHFVNIEEEQQKIDKLLDQVDEIDNNITKKIKFGKQNLFIYSFISIELINYFFKKNKIDLLNINDNKEKVLDNLQSLITIPKIYTLDDYFKNIEK